MKYNEKILGIIMVMLIILLSIFTVKIAISIFTPCTADNTTDCYRHEERDGIIKYYTVLDLGGFGTFSIARR